MEEHSSLLRGTGSAEETNEDIFGPSHNCLAATEQTEEISLDVDDENITLRGQHRSEGEDGFENSEFMKTIKLPKDVDPTTVTSHVTRNGSVLVLSGIKRVEKKIKPNDDKFVAKLNLHGFKPEEINIQGRGHELMVIAKHRS